MARILYTRRLLKCTPAESHCAVCNALVSTNLFDADFLARGCLPCGWDSGIAEIELSSAGIAQPDDALIHSNPL